MRYFGRIKDVFIPGYRDSNGRTHDPMEASLVGFLIDIFVYDNGKRIEDTEIPNQIIVIEKDTNDSASFYVKDWVEIPFIVIKGYNWDVYNKVFVNLNVKPCITKISSPDEEH